MINGDIRSDGTFTIDSNGNNNIKIGAGTAQIILGNGNNAGAEVCVSTDGGTTCTGKIDVGTVDPPYTIEGKHYATYMTAMTGVKEETTGTVQTNEYIPGIGYRSVIDFANNPEGSDIWLFGLVTDLSRTINQLVVLLSPSASVRSWYVIDPIATADNYTSRPTTVSYRLMPRLTLTRGVTDAQILIIRDLRLPMRAASVRQATIFRLSISLLT